MALPKHMLLSEIQTDIKTLQNRKALAQHIDGNYREWVKQVKENGERIFLHIKNGRIVGITNRRGDPCLAMYPELKELKFGFDEALVDGEVCLINNNGKSIFYNERDEQGNIIKPGIQYRSKSVKDAKTIAKHPVTIVAFDVLKFNGTIITSKPYKDRHEILKQNIKDDNSKFIKVAENYDDFGMLWDKVVGQNLEGVVLKHPMGIYDYKGGRSRQQLKLKNYKVADVIVDDYEPNDKGVKILGKATINNKEINVECQLANIDSVQKGEKIEVKYLDIVGNRMIQPHKTSMVDREIIESLGE